MSQVVVSKTISFPVSAVWASLADFGSIHRYSAGVASSPINAGMPRTGIGAERNCLLYDGNNIQERITQFDANERLALEVFQTSMPLKRADARFDLVATTADQCQLTMTMNYTVKFGPLGRLMDSMMLNKAMTRSLNGLLAALEEHLRTGEEITEGWTPAAAA